jgi:ceramide glucosyltransferase
MAIVLLLLLVAACTSLALLLLATAATLRRLHRRPGRPAEWPAVSVLKPLKGTEPGLAENLESLYRQDYPCFEVIFAVADAADPAVAVAAEVARRHPAVPTRFALDVPARGWNPKVNNLVGAAALARHQLLLISDANVRADRTYLAETVACLLAERAHLVSNLFLGRRERTLGAACENLHFASFVAPGVALADAARQPCVVGKSMLFRRADLAAAGGFAAVADVLAEDYLLGALFARHGLRVRLASHPLAVHNEDRTLAEFVARQLRWAQMRFRIAPLAYLCEPLLAPLPLAAATAGLALLAGAPITFTAAAGVGLATLALKVLLLARLRRPEAPAAGASAWRHGLRLAWIAPLQDALILWTWLAAMFRDTVVWQGHRFRIGRGSTLHPLPTPPRAPRLGPADPAAATPRGLAEALAEGPTR